MEDADLVRLAATIYDSSFQGWDKYYDGTAPDGICAGLKNNVLVFRGSYTFSDWMKDFEVFKLGYPKSHPQFGTIHDGFDEGLDEFFAKVAPYLSAGTSFVGHSLGAARAQLAAGRYILAGGVPAKITTFGSPKPGCQQFAQFLAPYAKSSYKNGVDPVTDVPLVIGTELAVAAVEPIALQETPTDWHEGLMAWHNILLYEKGIAG
jgi:predicted lipase